MGRLNRDAVIAIVLLMACGILFWSTFSIRVPDYGQLRPSTWPRVVLGVLTLLSAIYLVQSLRHGPTPMDEPGRGDPNSGDGAPGPKPGLIGWILYWRNPLWCFGLFFAYLVTLPVLGSLIGGVLFVFTLMGVLGGWNAKNLLQHAALALISVGGMWSIFTYGLGVILPPGEIFSPF
ncbi:MAG: tripartite tricarboxylate transporter TctB family protein [Alphaproteobacteria bacterium]